MLCKICDVVGQVDGMDARLKRLFTVFNVPTPSDDALECVYSVVTKRWIQDFFPDLPDHAHRLSQVSGPRVVQ